jgi:hypothetical protein
MFTMAARASSADTLGMPKRAGPPLARIAPYTREPRRDAASSNDGDVSRHAVLIFSADPLAAALLGAVVELAGHAPHFPRQDEAARSALMRVRPALVLIDCDHEETCSDAFIGPALMTGAQVLLHRSCRTRRESREFAGRLGLRVVELPNDQEMLMRLLQELLAR